MSKISTALLVAICLSLLATSPLNAAPVACSNGTYADLLGTNPGGGCFIDDKVFSNFMFNATSSGTPAPIPLTSSQVQVNTVSNGTSDIGFQFVFSLAAGTQETNDILLQYTVSTMSGLAKITSEHLSETGNFSGTGSAMVDETLCLGAAFSGGSCAGATAALKTFSNTNGVVITDAINFAPVSIVGVRKDINTAGFSMGTATMSEVGNTVDQIPEPTTMLLMGTGLLFAGIFSRRSKKA
jgi:PEP-CTERM motif